MKLIDASTNQVIRELGKHMWYSNDHIGLTRNIFEDNTNLFGTVVLVEGDNVYIHVTNVLELQDRIIYLREIDSQRVVDKKEKG